MEELMSLIDENSQRMPEGDYIRMCECMKQLNKKQKILHVTPDVVSEDFIMTSDALNRCHKWIASTDSLKDAFIEHERDPENQLKLGIFRQIREASKLYWRELKQTRGFDELMWFVNRGSNARMDFRYYSIKE